MDAETTANVTIEKLAIALIYMGVVVSFKNIVPDIWVEQLYGPVLLEQFKIFPYVKRFVAEGVPPI